MVHPTFTFKFLLTVPVLVAAWLSASGVDAADAVLIEFSSSHCAPCRAMQPVVAELERGGVPVRHVDVMSEPHLATRFGIRSTPTFIVLAAGKEVTRLTGSQTLQQLREALAINPSGPLIQTGAQWKPQRPSPTSQRPSPTSQRPSPTSQRPSPTTQPFDSAPQTRMAMLTNHTMPEPTPTTSNSEAMPSSVMADAVQRAEAATVRLRVYDGNGFGAGTGTIIDTHGEEALVLTCGHLFRETKGEGKIEVDLFVGGDVKTVAGQVFDYDSEDRDIALVIIRPEYPVQPVPLVQAGQRVRTGEVAFSFGCDRGDPPTRRDTRITGVNKYNQHLGVSNLEISGAPIDGRSGGGLFDDQGRLIGVCNAADYKEDLGIYAGPGSVHWQLDKVNLAHLFQSQPQPPAPNPDAAPERLAALPTAPNPVVQASATQMLEPSVLPGKEVIVIIRDRNNPNGSAEVKTITEPTADFMQMITRQ